MVGPIDTIFAPASGNARAALTVVRISGPLARETLEQLAGTLPAPRRVSLRRIRSPVTAEELDQAVVVWMPGPQSYTGADTVELHLHGGPAVLEGVADALALLGCRPAAPGEFSRRAFLNGRMDLTQIEGVADLVAAETAAQRRQALFQLQGGLKDLYRGWTKAATRLLAHQEAFIEFEAEDLPDELCERLRVEVRGLQQAIARHLSDGHRGEHVRQGVDVAILGAPNAGKSSLLNALAGRDAAIVSPKPGTTRDVVECRVEIEGIMFTFADTAGLRETSDAVEAEGMRRAVNRAETADLVLAVFALDAVPDAATLDQIVPLPNSLIVANKCDLAPLPSALASLPSHLAVSARTGEGLTDLKGQIARAIGVQGELGEKTLLTRPRHRAALSAAVSHLSRATTTTHPEILAEELRGAVRSLGSLTGTVGVEEVLDLVFADFCIGK